MANLNAGLFKLDSLDKLNPKLTYFNNYMQEFAQTGLKQAGKAIGDLKKAYEQIDLPLVMRLIMFTAKNIEGVPFLPFIVLPINPETFKTQFKKKSDVVYTLGGFVINHWHDDVITISASGLIPSFKSRAKVLTLSYQAFIQLLNLYKSCGQIGASYDAAVTVPTLDQYKITNQASATEQSATARSISSLELEAPGAAGAAKDTIIVAGQQLRNATIQMIYQSDTYEGIFTDFAIDEMYEMPNTLRYTFNFKAVKHTSTVSSILEGLNSNSVGTGNVLDTETIEKSRNIADPGKAQSVAQLKK